MKLLLIFVVAPLLASFLITALGRRIKYFSEISVNAVSLLLLVVSVCFVQLVRAHGTAFYEIGGWAIPSGICLVVDGLASFMLVTVNLICFLVMLYAVNYMKRYTDTWKFYALFMFMLAGMNGIIISGDIFNLYLFLEVASISGYSLVAFGIEPEDLEASFKYAILGSVASLFILLGIAFLYSHTSTLNMADIALTLSAKPAGKLTGFICVLFLAGFGLKAAIVPFHAWLPDAHSCAPSPVSAVLSGVFIKTLGIYALARIFFNVVGVTSNLLFVLMVLGIISMVAGALLAIAQDDIKRMFAYSSISQVGFIVFALGVGTPLAILGGLFHLFNHAVFKSLLFLNAGAIEYATGERRLSRLGGLSAKLPVTGYTSLLGSMSISGIPPFAGFFSKLFIILAAIEAGFFGFAFIAVLVTIATLAYYLKFQTYAFLGKGENTYSEVKEVPFGMKLPMLILAAISLTAGILLIPACKPFLESAVKALAQGSIYKEHILSLLR